MCYNFAMLKIKLARGGSTNKPFFRIVVLDKKKKPTGKFLETLGTFNKVKGDVSVKADRVSYWLGAGAKMTKGTAQVLKK